MSNSIFDFTLMCFIVPVSSALLFVLLYTRVYPFIAHIWSNASNHPFHPPQAGSTTPYYWSWTLNFIYIIINITFNFNLLKIIWFTFLLKIITILIELISVFKIWNKTFFESDFA